MDKQALIENIISRVQRAIGHDFGDCAMLKDVVEHMCARHGLIPATTAETARSAERLEFLGDRVLGLAIATALTKGNAKVSLGDVAVTFNTLVKKSTCASIATTMGLKKPDQLPKTAASQSIYGDAVEGVIGALHLTAGWEFSCWSIQRLWQMNLADPSKQYNEAELGSALLVKYSKTKSSRSALQEYTQSHKMGLPVYSIQRKGGTDHSPLFEASVRIENGQKSNATAKTKQDAQASAAAALLKKLTKPS